MASVGAAATIARPIPTVALTKSVAIVAVIKLALSVAQAIISVVMAKSAAEATAKPVAPMLDGSWQLSALHCYS